MASTAALSCRSPVGLAAPGAGSNAAAARRAPPHSVHLSARSAVAALPATKLCAGRSARLSLVRRSAAVVSAEAGTAPAPAAADFRTREPKDIKVGPITSIDAPERGRLPFTRRTKCDWARVWTPRIGQTERSELVLKHRWRGLLPPSSSYLPILSTAQAGRLPWPYALTDPQRTLAPLRSLFLAPPATSASTWRASWWHAALPSPPSRAGARAWAGART